MRLKFFLIILSGLLFCCQYFEDISRPADVAEEVPSALGEAEKFFVEKRAFDLYQQNPRRALSINKIYIFNRPVSTKDEFIPRLVNFFHWTTEKSLLKNELLFQENSPASLEDVAESERLLRLLSSVKEASIYLSSAEDPGTYDAYVYTEDRVTSTVNSNIEFSGGYSRILLSAGDLNFFGRLVEISGIYDRENFVSTYGIDTGQARLFGTPLEARFSARESFVDADSRFSVGGLRNYTYQKLSLERDFRSVSDRYAMLAEIEHGRGIQYRFVGPSVEQVTDPETGNTLEMVLGRDLLNLNFEIFRAFGRLNRLEIGLGLGQTKDRHFFSSRSEESSINPRALKVSESAEERFLPVQENGRYVQLGLNLRSIEFISRKNFQRFSFTEDLFRGWVFTNNFRLADDSFGLPDRYAQIDSKLRFVYDKNTIRNDVSFRRAGRKVRTSNGPWLNDYFIFDNRSFIFTRHGTYGFLTNLKYGSNLDRDNQFEFGGDYVRGFARRSRIGSLAYLLSMEFRTPPVTIRPWLIEHISKYFLFGAVIFFDIGEVKNDFNGGFQKLSPEPVLGLGFRSSAVEFDNNLFRFDFGIPLRSSSFSFANYVSFGLEHTF